MSRMRRMPRRLFLVARAYVACRHFEARRHAELVQNPGRLADAVMDLYCWEMERASEL